jgi:protein involved in polysaccharide export with SLBB domain
MKFMSANTFKTWLKKVTVSLLTMSFMSMSVAQTSTGFIGQLQNSQDVSSLNSTANPNANVNGTNPAGARTNVPGLNSLTTNQQQNYVQPRPLRSFEIPKPSEFELYVSGVIGEPLQRFGSDLVKDGEQTYSPSSTAAVPNDYIIAAGDELYVRVWGSVDADLRLVVDRQGQVVIPKVGAVQVAGVPYGGLSRTIQAAIGKTYSGANVAASIGQMRGIRVYVTGYAQTPGAYTVNNLSSLVNVVMAAGGPSAAGSFRQIQLKRAGKVISTFDLYDLLLKGDKSADRPVTAEDVIHVGPAGTQVAITGAVNKPAIYEIKAGESLQDLLAYAGGFVSGANSEAINYLGLTTRQQGFKSVANGEFVAKKLLDGDIYLATSEVALRQPVDKQMRMVRVDGQVNKPGLYVLKPGQTLQDALLAAGGLAPAAYLYGARLERVSVRNDQEKNLERFRKDAKRDLSNAQATKQTTIEDAEITKTGQQRTAAILSALEEIKADGRITLGIRPNAKNLPPILLESGDVLTIPSKPSSVSVMGSIPAGQVVLTYDEDQSVYDYIKMAGGFSRGADTGKVYVKRANGEYVSTTGWFSKVSSLDVMPGDAIFIPEDLNKTTFTKELKDWTQIIYQLGLGAAAITVLK